MPSNSLRKDPVFSMRIVSTDHYMTEPVPGLDMVYSEFRRTPIYRVPVLRVFGPTLNGQKTCMNIHGVFPYLYAVYDGTLPPGLYLQQFASSLDKAINISQGKTSSTMQHVYKVSLVSGLPFYGYHSEAQPFLKIYLFNPLLIKKVADLLLAGAVMNRIIQPHESHIPYTLQMFMDYNLFGMNFVNAAAVKIRQPLPCNAQTPDLAHEEKSSMQTPSVHLVEDSLKFSGSCSTHRWTISNIPQDFVLPLDVKKMSTCDLEVDVVAADILNRLEVDQERIGDNPGLVALWEDEKQRRINRQLSAEINPPSSPDRRATMWTTNEFQMQQRLQDILHSLETYMSHEDGHSENQSSDISVTPSQQLPAVSNLEPVVNEASISQVLSSSQNFAKKSNTSTDASQLLSSSFDLSLVNILAALADSQLGNSQPPKSPSSGSISIHQILSQVTSLEDKDSLLSQVTSTDENAAEIEAKETKESIEMSQILEDEMDVEYERYRQSFESDDLIAMADCEENSLSSLAIGHRNTSQSIVKGHEGHEEGDEDDSDCDSLPQLDGPAGLRKLRSSKLTARNIESSVKLPDNEIITDTFQNANNCVKGTPLVMSSSSDESVGNSSSVVSIHSSSPERGINYNVEDASCKNARGQKRSRDWNISEPTECGQSFAFDKEFEISLDAFRRPESTRKRKRESGLDCISSGNVRKSCRKALRSDSSENECSVGGQCLLDSGPLIMTQALSDNKLDASVRCGRVFTSKMHRFANTVARNTRKRFKLTGDQKQLNRFKDVIKEARIVVEKLDLSGSSIHLSEIKTGAAKLSYESHSLDKLATSDNIPNTGESDKVKVSMVPKTDSLIDKKTNSMSDISISCRYTDDADDECLVEYADVLTRFALLSSPETSDLESEGPTPTSPTQEHGCCSNHLDETLVSGKDLDLTDTEKCLDHSDVNKGLGLMNIKFRDGSDVTVFEDISLRHSSSVLDTECISSEVAFGLGARSVDMFSESSRSVKSVCSTETASDVSEICSKTDASTVAGMQMQSVDSELMSSHNRSKLAGCISSVASAEGSCNLPNAELDQLGFNENHLVMVRPVVDPPSRSQVWSDVLSDGFPLKKPGDAFYSNPADVPPRLRIGESEFLSKVKSPLVSDLLEHEFSRGLKHWQMEAMARELATFGHSQTTKGDILKQFSAQPSLCNILIKDKEVVVTPCRSPPRPSAVREFLKMREKSGKDEKARKEQAIVSKNVEEEKEEVQDVTLVSIKPLVQSSSGACTDDLNENECSKEVIRISFPRQEEMEDETIVLRHTSQSAGRDLSLTAENSIAQNTCLMGIPKASFIELEIPGIMCKDDGKCGTDCEESKTNGTKDLDAGFTGSQLRLSGDLPDSGDRLPDVVASTPVHALRPESERLKLMEQELLRCTPIRNAEENWKMDSVPESATLPDAAKNLKADDSRGTPLSTRPRQRQMEPDVERQTSSFRRVLPLRHMGCEVTSSTMKEHSQIEGPTLRNTFGFKVDSQNVHDAKALHDYQYLTVLSAEVHVATRGDLLPDPECDEIRAIFYCIHYDCPPHKAVGPGFHPYVILVDRQDSECDNPSGRQPLLQKSGLSDVDVTYVATEDMLLTTFVDVVKRHDADVLVGFEIQRSSWGYLLQRAAHLNRDLCSQLSRIPGGSLENHFEADKDEYGAHHMSEIHIAGRIVLNLWRLARHEVTLNVYSFENVAYHVLHQRFPKYSSRSLTEWFDHRSHLYRWKTVEYFMTRSRANLQFIEKLDLIGQTSEFARIYGIEFYDVLNRGSQYRVESMMLRMAKPLNFIAVSPSVQQRARMRAPECIPLNLEPESEFYAHPVIVLDFQSLYPSIMIAYNYCFSTCLGRIDNFSKLHEGPIEFGCTLLSIPPKLLQSLANDVSICPNGIVFVKQHVRKGVMSRMVEDILNTRLMVKRSMKEYKKDKSLQRLLHARQLGLKLIANVTFGYAAANFSGRMPCVEVGDSILRKSRETLERAIHLVEATPKWSAKVVYGDTDSMFILLHGRTKEEAFVIGQEIADAVTADNPKPVKLRFEKVYMPCILQTKKRYVGFMYESVDQTEPTFDAKGIETVRRDNCAAVSKILEKSIKLLFSTHDVSLVKKYVQQQFVKIMEGRTSLQDFIFAKEFRGLTGYQPGACVPALEIAKRAVGKDRRAVPLVGERVPYVIVFGIPGQPLIQLVRQPHDVLADPSMRINTVYYITKQIVPPLSRVFSLLGVNVLTWYQDLPRVLKSVPVFDDAQETKKGTISRYFVSLNCPVCEEITNSGICAECKNDRQRTALVLGTRIHSAESSYSWISQVCVSCMGCVDPQLPCVSLDCPVFFRLVRASRDISAVPQLQTLQHQLLQF